MAHRPETMTVAEYKALLVRKPRCRRRPDDYDSEAERVFAANVTVIMWSYLQVVVHEVRHHPLTFHLPGDQRYTPDFRLRTASGNYMIEVKPGDRISKSGKVIKPGKNRRDARSKLKTAAEVFPEYTFVEARIGNVKDPLKWELEVI